MHGFIVTRGWHPHRYRVRHVCIKKCPIHGIWYVRRIANGLITDSVIAGVSPRDKIRAALASILLLGTASAGWAEHLAQPVPVSRTSEATPFDVVFLPFDGASGTLTNVVVQLSGMYVPLLTYGGGPFPTTAYLITTMFPYSTNAGSSGADRFASSAGALESAPESLIRHDTTSSMALDLGLNFTED